MLINVMLSVVEASVRLFTNRCFDFAQHDKKNQNITNKFRITTPILIPKHYIITSARPMCNIYTLSKNY